MRVPWIAVVIALGAAFFVGRASQPTSAGAQVRSHVYVARSGDTVRVPAAAVRCKVTGEAGRPDFFCERIPTGRYQVVFFTDMVQVWRVGNPNKPAFAKYWRP